ncbi:uncharacterized protein LOC134223783 [Armigeres subalbatus]|uniref:uncharacterized protein LOC134223783 n=1 Tax=Armigeres subalbatus TaxID=124917 RepID=UPI002ED6A119
MTTQRKRPRTSTAVLSVLVAGALILTVLARNCSANFVAYEDQDDVDKDNTDLEEYVHDEEQKRADYHDAIDRLISHALNETRQPENRDAGVKVAATNETERDEDLTCAGNRSPKRINALEALTVKKCCPMGQSFLHESISKCRFPLRPARLPVVSRELHFYDRSCYRFGPYLKHNLTIDGHCIGKHLVFNDGAMFTVIQNGSLMVSTTEQLLMYKDFCLEETGSSVLVAHVCDAIVFPDPFDWVDKMIIGSALLVLSLTVLLYAFESSFQTVFGRLILIHAALLFTALLLEAALTEFNEAFYSTIVYVLIGAAYVLYAAANLYALCTGLSNYQKIDSRNVVYLALGGCILWVVSVLFTMYFNDKLVALCTIFSGLVLSVFVNLIILRGTLKRRHHLLTAMDSCYEISDSSEYSTYVHHRKELAILCSFASTIQLLHWILFLASRYNLLYALSCCGLTIFAVFVCFRYRSITLLPCSRTGDGSISKVLRHRQQRRQHPTHYQQQQEQLPSSEEPTPTVPPWENGYNQLHAAASPPNGTHQQQHHSRDNQKHSLASVVEEQE